MYACEKCVYGVYTVCVGSMHCVCMDYALCTHNMWTVKTHTKYVSPHSNYCLHNVHTYIMCTRMFRHPSQSSRWYKHGNVCVWLYQLWFLWVFATFAGRFACIHVRTDALITGEKKWFFLLVYITWKMYIHTFVYIIYIYVCMYSYDIHICVCIHIHIYRPAYTTLHVWCKSARDENYYSWENSGRKCEGRLQ